MSYRPASTNNGKGPNTSQRVANDQYTVSEMEQIYIPIAINIMTSFSLAWTFSSFYIVWPTIVIRMYCWEYTSKTHTEDLLTDSKPS